MSQLDAEGVVETGSSNDAMNLEGWLKSKGLQSIASNLKESGLSLKDLLNCSEDDIRSFPAFIPFLDQWDQSLYIVIHHYLQGDMSRIEDLCHQ